MCPTPLQIAIGALGKVARVPRFAAPDAPPPYSVAGLVAGLILSAFAVLVTYVIAFTRATGGIAPCCFKPCSEAVEPVATCCGLCPMRKRRPTSTGPTGLPKVKSWRAAPQVAQTMSRGGGEVQPNPLQSTLSLRSINVALGTA